MNIEELRKRAAHYAELASKATHDKCPPLVMLTVVGRKGLIAQGYGESECSDIEEFLDFAPAMAALCVTLLAELERTRYMLSAAQTAGVADIRRVVASACRADGITIVGVRHFDQVMHGVIEALGMHSPAREWEQGFVDNRGEFLDRHEGFIVATAANQIVQKHGRPHELYSEDFIPGYIPATSPSPPATPRVDEIKG